MLHAGLLPYESLTFSFNRIYYGVIYILKERLTVRKGPFQALLRLSKIALVRDSANQTHNKKANTLASRTLKVLERHVCYQKNHL